MALVGPKSLRRGHRFRRDAFLSGLSTAAVAAVIVGLSFLVAGRLEGQSPVVAGALAALAVLPVWFALSSSYAVTLAVLGLYLGVIDGVIKMLTASPAATLGRDVLLYSMVFGAVVRLLADRRPLRVPPLTGFVTAWVVIVLVQVFNPGTEGIVRGLAVARPHLEFVPLFFFGYAVMREPHRLRMYLLLLCVIAAANGAMGAVQFNMSPEQLAAWGPGYEQRITGSKGFEGAGGTFADESGEARVRPFGLGSDVGAGGAWGVLAVPAVLALLATAPKRWSGRLGAPLAVGTILAVATSQSRSVVLAAVVAALAFSALAVASQRRAAALAVLATVLALSVGVASVLTGGSGTDVTRYEGIGPSDALSSTLDYRQGTLELIPKYAADFPLGAGLGLVGPGTGFKREVVGLTALNGESQFTFLLVEVGIAGLLVFGLVHLRLLVGTARVRRIADPELRLLLAGCFAGLFALAGSWLAGPIAVSTPYAPYFWFTAGVVAFWCIDRGDLRSWSGASPQSP